LWTWPRRLLNATCPVSLYRQPACYLSRLAALAAPNALHAQHVSPAESAFCDWRGCSAHTWRILTILARHEPFIMRPSSYARQLIGFIGVVCLLLCQARPVPCDTASDSGAAAANSRSSNPCVQAPVERDASASAACSEEHGVQIPPTDWRSNACALLVTLHTRTATRGIPRRHHSLRLVEVSACADSVKTQRAPTVKHRCAGSALRALLQFSANGAFPDLGPGFPDLNSLLGPGFGAALSPSPPPGAHSCAWAPLRRGA